MPPVETETLQWILPGLLLLVTAYVLRRTARRQTHRRKEDLAGRARPAQTPSEQAARDRIQALEVRLHDYQREVEGRITTRLAQLDQLIQIADREIERLGALVEQSSGVPPDVNAPNSPAAGDSRLRAKILCLCDAGYTHREIAHIAECPETVVERMLGFSGDPGREAA